MSEDIVNGDEEIETIDEFLVTLSELAEDYRYLFDYPILVVETEVKSFMIMNKKDFDELFKSVVGDG